MYGKRNFKKRRQASIDATGKRKHRPDYVLVLLSAILVVVGLIVVYAISPGISAARGLSESEFIFRQFIAAGIALIAFIVVSNLPLGIWRKFEKPLIVCALLLALAVQLFGEEVNGAQRWIQIGGLSFQAAELTKLALAVWLAGFLSDRVKNGEISDFKKTIRPLLITLVIVSVIVAGFESDFGSAAVMLAMMVSAVFVVGMPFKKIALVGLIISSVLFLAIITSDYRRERVATFFNPQRDCQNEGYQICESLKAIGSGGMIGKGLGRSVQAYGYLPEASNDSIFAIIAEKFGFVGTTVLLGVFIALFTRIKNVIVKSQALYTRILLSAILTWFSVQAIINIGAMVGLLPLKGITLPFISTGGTSLLFVSIALGIVFNASRYTSYATVLDEDIHEIQSDNNNTGGSPVNRAKERPVSTLRRSI